MATFRGQDGSVTVDAATMIEVVEWSLSAPRERLEDSVMGDASKTYKLGQKDWSARVRVRFDYGDTAGQKAMLDQALATTPTAIAFEFLVATGKKFVGSGFPELSNAASGLGNIAEAEFNIIPSGDLSISWV